ncbi:MAG: JAB domain-containing protein [Candidatus Woesebacteria bacterium]|jgi:DNA repair protein RadC
MDKTKPLLTVEDILPYLKFIRNKRQEYTICLSLDSGQRLIARRVVTIGTLTASLVHPREIFAGPLKDRAASIIVAHNHPSGDPRPSRTDLKTTQHLVAGGILLGVCLRDHIIVAKEEYYSFSQSGLV